jgi:hypothetical protein
MLSQKHLKINLYSNKKPKHSGIILDKHLKEQNNEEWQMLWKLRMNEFYRKETLIMRF